MKMFSFFFDEREKIKFYEVNENQAIFYLKIKIFPSWNIFVLRFFKELIVHGIPRDAVIIIHDWKNPYILGVGRHQSTFDLRNQKTAPLYGIVVIAFDEEAGKTVHFKNCLACHQHGKTSYNAIKYAEHVFEKNERVKRVMESKERCIVTKFIFHFLFLLKQKIIFLKFSQYIRCFL